MAAIDQHHAAIKNYFSKRFKKATRENVIHFLTFDTEYGNSIVSAFRAARERTFRPRDHFLRDVREQSQQILPLMVTDPAAKDRALDSPSDFYNDVKMASHLFSGLTRNTMSHNEAWHFGRLGRLLERADKTSRMLDVKYFILLPAVSDVGSPLDDIQWSAVLRSASAFEMYRKRHGRIAPRSVVEFLLLESTFPRSVRFSADAAEASLHAISGTPLGRHRNLAEQRLNQVCSELDFADAKTIMKQVAEFLDDPKPNSSSAMPSAKVSSQRPAWRRVTNGHSSLNHKTEYRMTVLFRFAQNHPPVPRRMPGDDPRLLAARHAETFH
jgi:uncharacterized alpha-E superfamily protein